MKFYWLFPGLFFHANAEKWLFNKATKKILRRWYSFLLIRL